jgi:multidrug efflux system membrane fusion protein
MLEQAEGQLLKDQATLDNARVDLARYEKLLKQNAIQEQIYATQKATLGQAEGTVKADQGVIDSVKLNLTYCKITSPLTGRPGLRLVDPGNIVHASDTNGLLVITQVQPISVLFTLAEDQLPTVLRKLNTGEHLRADAYDRADHQKLATGTLASVDNQIDPSTGTLRLRATFDNHDSALFPNQFVNVHLLVQEKSGVTLIPTAAIQRTSTTQYVWVVKDDSTVTDRTITEGVVQGDESEITSGVAPGDVVVMTGVDRLIEGAPVRAQIAGEQPAAKSGQPAAQSGGKKK